MQQLTHVLTTFIPRRCRVQDHWCAGVSVSWIQISSGSISTADQAT